VAIFNRLVAELQRRRSNLRGRLLVLFDADQHTDHFAGVETFLRHYRDIDGVMIGYPGNHGSSPALAASTERRSRSTLAAATPERAGPAPRTPSRRRQSSCKPRWPSYRLTDHAPVARARLAAAREHHNPHIATIVCGPSNIGNYLAAHQIEATCGFGVTYENLHAPNERIKLDTIEMTHAVYSAAIQSLLTPASECTTTDAAC
jgi:hypothetical protein